MCVYPHRPLPLFSVDIHTYLNISHIYPALSSLSGPFHFEFLRLHINNTYTRTLHSHYIDYIVVFARFYFSILR